MLSADSPFPVRSGGVIPVIEIWGHLLVPLQGDIADWQMQSMSDDVLHRTERVRRHAPQEERAEWSHLARRLRVQRRPPGHPVGRKPADGQRCSHIIG